MTLGRLAQPEANTLIRIRFLKVVRGIMVKDRALLIGLSLLFAVSSTLIYQLSSGLIEKTTAQVYTTSSGQIGKSVAQIFTNPNSILYFRLILLITPIAIGMMAGVPLLAADYENGVYRFLFTQGVGRRRLFRTTLMVYFTLFIAGSSLMALSVSHFYQVQQQAGPLTIWSLAVFFLQPIILFPLVLATFSSGVFIGSWLRRTVTGMATTLAVYAITGLALSTLFDKALASISKTPTSNDPSHIVQLQVLYAALFLLISVISILGTVYQIGGRGTTSRRKNSQ
jgi:hypothetical protein